MVLDIARFTSSDLALTMVPFNARSLDIVLESMQQEIGPSFSQLVPDQYDVRREIGAIVDHCDESGDGETIWSKLDCSRLAFYQGKVPVDRVFAALQVKYGKAVADRARKLRPYRHKARSQFRMIEHGTEWEVVHLPLEPLVQDVATSDIRTVPREYPDIVEDVRKNASFLKLLKGVATMVNDVESDVTELEIGAWQVRLVSQSRGIASNAPEGIHQDGADYIVSAFVMNRENARGGESIVIGPDGKTPYYAMVLDPGQGIFQADKPERNFQLWHNVTPICPRIFGSPAIRDTFGFDVKIIKREEDAA